MKDSNNHNIKEVKRIESMDLEGVTEPIICELDSGERVVVKYPRNRFGTIVLVREWIGANVAETIGVPFPKYGKCHLGIKAIEEGTALGIIESELDERNVGTSFYTLYENSSPVQVHSLKRFDKKLEIIVLYDYLLNNCDRHKGNLLQTMSKVNNYVFCIDNSHIITYNDDTNKSLDQYFDDKNIYSMRFFEENKALYSALLSGCCLIELQSKACIINNQLTEDVFNKIVSTMPNEWVEAVGETYLADLLKIIKLRIKALPLMCEIILKEGQINE